ncbi:Nucleoporin NUP57 [Nakaseomyces bracarensis]|uniref:Nucleoporin NUP57 n=1 Tax=Nakaseomyces bracarensis TaxID=273131 RepID=A0ABR4NUH3_9SACH
MFARNSTGGFGSNTGATGGNSMFGNTGGNTGFSFGQNNQQQQAQQPQSGGMFGSQQNNQQQGLFGQPQQSNQPSGGLFGQNQQQNTQQPSTGLFGQSQSQNNQQGGSLFGGQQSNQSGTTGLFGANNAQQSSQGSTGLFGNKPAAGGLFGQNNNQPPQQQAGGLFGQNQAQPQQPSGGLFGQNQNQQTQSGGLFGNTSNQNNTTGTSGGLFGAKPAGTTGGLFGSKPAGTTGGLFSGQNNSASAPATGGLFGSNQQSSGGLFGSKPAGTGSTSGGLFGSKPLGSGTTGLFGGANQQNQGTGLFGNNQQQQQQQQTGQQFGGIQSSQPSFGWSKPSTQSSTIQQPPFQPQVQQPQLAAQQLQSQQLSGYPQLIQEQVLKCKESWDPNSYKTKLRSFVYNKVNETDAILYTKPTNVSQEEWDKALEQKTSSDVIPIQVYGFEGLNSRNQVQIENVAQARVILNQILDKSTQLQQTHSFDTAARIMKVQARNVQIEKRILKLGTQLAILKNRRLPLTIAEEKMWGQFQELLKHSNDPAGLGKTNELWARLTVLKERAKTISDQLDSKLTIIGENGGQTGKQADGTPDEVNEKIDKVAEILSNQQRGIAYLNDVLEKDSKALDAYIANKS